MTQSHAATAIISKKGKMEMDIDQSQNSEINPYDYNAHWAKIANLRSQGADLASLRLARLDMARIFPLTEGWFSANYTTI